MFFDQSENKLEINNNILLENVWKLSKMPLSNPWFKEETTENIGKQFELNDVSKLAGYS